MRCLASVSRRKCLPGWWSENRAILRVSIKPSCWVVEMNILYFPIAVTYLDLNTISSFFSHNKQLQLKMFYVQLFLCVPGCSHGNNSIIFLWVWDATYLFTLHVVTALRACNTSALMQGCVCNRFSEFDTFVWGCRVLKVSAGRWSCKSTVSDYWVWVGDVRVLFCFTFQSCGTFLHFPICLRLIKRSICEGLIALKSLFHHLLSILLFRCKQH